MANYNGIINVYKEAGFTSFDVVAKLRGICQQKKIGHTGTLDPDATGVLPVCLGNATKVCELLTDHDKVYEAELLLGQETDTQDISGKVINSFEGELPDEATIAEVIKSFVGEQLQVPPMYSALKVDGQKLCDLARKGIEVERKARPITIYSIDILDISLPVVRMRVACSKGTYIRTLCNDIGIKAGCYGTMKSLIRTKVSCFEIKDAVKLSEIQKLKEEDRLIDIIRSVDSLFEDYPKLCVKEYAQKYLQNGNVLKAEDFEDGEAIVKKLDESARKGVNLQRCVRVYRKTGEFAAIYRYFEDGDRFKPEKMFL